MEFCRCGKVGTLQIKGGRIKRSWLYLPFISDLSQMQLSNPKRMLVLVNPCSGPGKALSIFQERIVPIFAESGIHFNMIITGNIRETLAISQI